MRQMKLGRICRHCEERSGEAIQNGGIHALDCFAEPVIGRRLASTRWLAMTASSPFFVEILLGEEEAAAIPRPAMMASAW
jgi:hypothetical protein